MIEQRTLEETWRMLVDDESSVLIDVRTLAEWQFVGIPALESIGKEVRLVEWTTFPHGQPNPDFVRDAASGLAPDQPLLLVCRSGVRSDAAARVLQAQGFTNTHNVTAGFEGNLGPDGHRSGGWKHEGLPWRQS